MPRAPRPQGRRRLAAWLALAAVFLASCQVEVRLTVDVDQNGSGSVEARFQLDAEAVEAIGGDLDASLRVDDLVASGWTVESDAVEGGGSVVTATRRFSGPDQLTGVIDELSGDTGPFRDFRLTRDTSFFRTSFEFSGTVDLEGGVGPSAIDPDDPTLAEGLAPEEVDIEELRQFVRERVDEAFSFAIVVALPGSGSHDAPATTGGEPVWAPSVGERIQLSASSSEVDVGSIVLVAVATLLAMAAIAVAAGRLGPERVRRLRSAIARRMRAVRQSPSPRDQEG